MNIQNILCPVDFSEISSEVIDRVRKIARRHDAKVHLVHVYEPEFPNGDLGAMPLEPNADEIEQLRTQLADTSRQLPGEIRCKSELIFGFPAGSLVGYASTNDIDVVVMGTHGRTGPSQVIMGSVAESVMRNAGCPVIVVHPKKTTSPT